MCKYRAWYGGYVKGAVSTESRAMVRKADEGVKAYLTGT
jgi:hypothetical protein